MPRKKKEEEPPKKEKVEKEENKEKEWEPNPAFIEMEECFKYLEEQK